ncbi:MAG TPA: phytanoyl-CoA dioxygenase family protein [Pirellulales bacterium]|nr:phytanoyl-CoA dioxygenase family protein [Pirellulales bacterium]
MRSSLDAEQCRQLDELGYVLLPTVMDVGLHGRLRERVEQLFILEGTAAGAEFKTEPGARRLANLVDKGSVFREIIIHPAVLPLVAHVLRGSSKLSSLNARSVEPHSDQPQPLHCDMGALPDERGAWVCNTVWMLDDFTHENGALRVVPGSHRWNRLPQEAMTDPRADHPQQVVVTGPSGSVIVMNAHLWHGGMANRTSDSRTAVHAFYCRRDKPQQQYQKGLLDAALQASLPAELRDLLALDDALNDELAGRTFARSGFLA